MKPKIPLRTLTILTSIALLPVAKAVPVVVDLGDLSGLTADYSAPVGNFSGIPGGGGTFNGADFGALNGTGSTTDASSDAATFQMTVSNLAAHSGSQQYFFESGGGGNGIGIHYSTGDIITFAMRTGNPVNRITFDATSLIGSSFDIVASVSPDDDFMRLFVNGAFVSELAIASNDNDWDGSSPGGFGNSPGGLVDGGSTGAFTHGTLSDFNYYHDIVVDSTVSNVPDGGATLALLGLSLFGLGAAKRRLGK